MKVINVAKDYHAGPAGRYRDDGKFSGERFREDFLVPAFRDNDMVQVDFSQAKTPGSSFLEESFGGLVRKGHLTKDELEKRLQIISPRDLLISLIKTYIREAVSENNG